MNSKGSLRGSGLSSQIQILDDQLESQRIWSDAVIHLHTNDLHTNDLHRVDSDVAQLSLTYLGHMFNVNLVSNVARFSIRGR